MRVAVLQFDPAADPSANASTLARAADETARAGANVLLAPEGSITNFLDDPGAPRRTAENLDGPFAAAILRASSAAGIVIAAGTFTPDPASARVHNTVLVAEDGRVAAAYHKIHLYDAFAHLESEAVAPGDEPAPVLTIGDLRVGLATCYDLRFPELFRAQVSQGADLLLIASAWVRGPLKEEHWMTLLRARAIENTCYVVAADQIGRNGIGRSAAFDPAGLSLLDLGARGATPGAEALGFVDVHAARVAEVRAALPCVQHIRLRVDGVPGPAAAPR